MKTLKQLLSEAFSDPYPYRQRSVSSTNITYKFESENDTIIVSFSRIKEMYVPKGQNPILYNMSFHSYDAKLKDMDEPTNKGDAFRVFATLIEITKEFYSRKNVGGIIISSKDDASRSRKMVYKRLIKKFGKGQTIEKVSAHKELSRSNPDLKSGTLIYKKGVALINPLDDFMRKSQPKLSGAFR